MDIAGMLAQSGALDAAARELGIDPRMASVGAAALLPAILGGFKSQAQASPQGLDGLGGLLGQLGGGGLLDMVVGSQPTPVEQGNSILGSIFGSRDVSRQVAAQASEQTGISGDTLKRLLPIVAMLVAGYLARSQSGGAAPSAPAAPAAPAAAPAGGGLDLGGVLGQVFRAAARGGRPAGAAPSSGGGLAGMLDMDGDGNPLNDIIGMAGRMRG